MTRTITHIVAVLLLCLMSFAAFAGEKPKAEAHRHADEKAKLAAKILKKEIGTWHSIWERIDEDGEVINTFEGEEIYTYAGSERVLEMTTSVHGRVAKGLYFYDPNAEKLTMISVGQDGEFWILKRTLDDDTLISEPHPIADGSVQKIRFITLDESHGKRRVLMEYKIDDGAWKKGYYQTMIRKKDH